MQAIRDDLTTRAAYVSDASIYRRVPAAVAEPSTVEEIRELLALARERGWPVTCRGGGTSVAGNAIGEGLVIDTSRHFNRILAIDPDAMTATIEPGVVCDDLQAATAEFGLAYGPDPSTHSRCTIGGMVANNACGSHSVVWGTSADNLVAVTVMLADGREVSLERGGTSDERVTRELERIRNRNLAVLRTELGQFPRQVSGYGLHHLLSENGFDAAKAFAGSEGTCGIITRLTVRLVRRPAHTALAVLGFADAFEAAAAAHALRVPGVYTIEGMGADLIEALRMRPGREDAGSQLPRGGGWLYCEVGADTADGARQRAGELAALVADRVVDSAVIPEGPEARALWAIREAGAGVATRLPDGGEAWPGWEDSAVPPARLAEYLRDLYALMDEYGYSGIPFGHFGEGCVHLRISFDLASEGGLARYRSFIHAAAELVHRYGGSVSGEHGDGRARSELLSTIYSPAALRAFAEFKRVFDPDGVFNPGVLVNPEPIDRGIRPGPGARTFDVAAVQAFSRDGGSFASAVDRCVGVGACRSDVGAMCPSFHVTRDEVHSTRGRARSLAEMLRGESITDGWKSRETLEALDLCLSCKACVAECPVNVDMATYKAEFLNRHYRSGLLSFVGPGRRPMAHFTMGWMPYVVRLLSKVPGAVRAVNWLESFGPVEALTKRLGGIEPRRRMITFATQPLTAWHRQRNGAARGGDAVVGRSGDAGETVVLWPDTFTNFAADAPGRAAVEVLEAMGYRVLIPMGEVCCGLTWHSTGQLGQAKRALRQTLDVVAPLLEAGCPIIGLEPSCTGMLTHEITELLPDDARAANVAQLAVGFGTFVAAHLDAGKAWPFRSLTGHGGAGDGGPAAAVCQVHCHQKALGEGAHGYGPELRVLERLGVATSVVGGGCCGLAGNWGFEPGHYEISQRLGERELFPAVRAASEETIVLADGFSCRTQIAQGTDREGVHLAEVLRSALPGQHLPGR
ncbi:FAD-binding and (Fe-S)-binding domain-containing protein [Sinomonas sp. JGH33]|uniref:FAD-binding and (Fe-S)-binding domain-containing protein n=1 Tax=Sinomonas terricola TaxID=3110330 RepID=A0ABU5T7J2_9MICC|nr:FAD-binding and (Fe-S)-binding domain-containing protein [Sinomonas sp. JGH33]MEA5455640.1 FAD-binding and (Fe-S)-binding domain-containing protein [Sinomonas sp. JGH33]